MANLQGINSEMSGKVGKYVYRQRNGKTVVSQAPRRHDIPRRSDKQMYVRCQVGNIAANYRLYTGRLALGFEDKVYGQSEFNLMVQANYGINPVFITKFERLNGGCVLAPYTFTRGTLPSIGLSLSGSVLVSELSIGALAISASTTVADLAMAILANNSGWKDGDQLTFFYGVQTVDSITGVPRASMSSWKVVLDTSNENLLSTVATTLGFTTVNGFLGMSTALSNAGAAWVHSRKNSDGTLQVGTQSLYVVNSLLTSYQSVAALNASANSYGGVNTKAVYLSPQDSVDVLASMSNAQTNPAAAEFNPDFTAGSEQSSQGTNGSNSGSQSGSGSGNTGDDNTGNGGSMTGSETSGNTGGNTGGDNTGGNQNENPPAVAAPVISGTSPFEETTSVTMSCSTDGATIYYTTDGSTPTAESTAYSEAITLSDTTTVKAIAIKDADSSTVSSRTFTKGEGGDGTDFN